MAATAIDSPGTALIVASDREDRRVLFDTLDTQAFDAIYSAKDIHSARGFVREDPDIHLVLLEFEENPREALSFCSDLRAQIATSTVPIIGILGPRRDAWNAENTPPGLIEWIASPVQPDDAKTRVGIALAARRSRTARSETVAIGSDRYQFVFDGGIDELAIVDPASGHILDVNEVFVQRSGHSLQELISAPIDAFDAVLTSEQRSELNLRLERDDNVYLRGRRRHANGSLYPIDMHVRRAVQDARVVHFYRFREIGELGNYQGALSAIGQLTERSPHEETTDTVLQAIVAWLGLDFVAAVEAPAELTGEAREIAVYHRFEPPQASSDPLRGAAMRRVLAGREVIHASHASSHCADDSFLRESRFEFVIGLPLVGERQTYLGAMLVARREPLEGDKTVVEGLRVAAFVLARELELRRTREQGRAEGLRDPLTGMPNRLLFNDRLNSAIREGSRTSEMFAVMFVDLDRFKNINDSLGHVVGDEVLKGVARRLRGCVRASDTVARYAGDEFTLILRHIVQRDDVVRIADKIVSAMEVPLQLAAGLELSVTASIGVSFYPDDAADAEKLLKHADVAMYAAKALGRNNHQVYVAVPEEAHRQRLALEAKLRVAEKKGELRVFYQPLVDGVSDDIVGMEALIRWQHPELGMIGPGFFIPLAEESGLIVSIGEWVLRTACRDASRWHKLFGLPLRLGVNLSPLQLRQPKFVDLCAMVIKQAEIDPHLLDLEITESISIKSIPNLLETLHNLRSLGCGISIDDFGTGQSSLDYIKRFPADRIKIDQTFVRNIGVDPDDEAIVEATISMAHNLNRKVVAEGVEIEQHLEFLRNQGCDTLQGFLFCRPLPAISFEKLLLERTRLLGQRR